ncbi:MFS transporter [Pararobbsia alpina]|uniref:Riboflavin transporter RibZ n=1 Tax=Pararobbsia alpina TaxID=621374 RepID=A0A6S7AZ04_9BURK|nr:MFS transporter [Pararobbsia alpina]CAB3781630.1 Riboflavin transporter RibZ [Pararobbsia alpina]
MLHPDGLPTPRRYWALLALALGTSLAVLDGAIANIALPTIGKVLQSDPATSVWVVNAYQMAIMISLLPLASLAERVGYRRVFLSGLVLFTAASLACALSTSLGTLIAARVIQGFGAAGLMSVNIAVLRMIFPVRQLGHGVAINASIVAVASAIGPTMASGILAIASWNWLFAVNVPIGIAAFAVGLRALPNNELHNRPYDYLSAVLNALTFGLAILAVDGLGHRGGQVWVVAEFLGAIVIGIIFVRRQLSQAAPLLPVDLLRIPPFAMAIGTSVCAFISQMLAFVSLPFYLQDALGRSQVETGLLMTPWPLTIVVIAPLAGYLSGRIAAGILGGIGLIAFALGLLLLATLPAHPSAFDIIWRMAICGFGYGMFQTPNNRAILSSAPRERSGGASGMLGAARLTGQTLGAAFVAVIFGVLPTHGTTVTLVVGAGFSALAAIVSLGRLASRPVVAA